MDQWEYLEQTQYYTRFGIEWDETMDFILMLPEMEDYER